MEAGAEATVWIANKCGHNYSDAERFGQLKALTIGNVNPLRVDRLAWEISRGIAQFVHEDDYFLQSGTQTVNVIAFYLWMLKFGHCNFLQWDARNRKYVLSRMEDDHLATVLEQQLT